MIAERTLVEPTPIRAAIGRRMVASKREAPHFYVSMDIEMDAVLAAIDAHNAAHSGRRKATVTVFLARAVTRALAAHPELNAVWDGDELYRVAPIHLGVAIALDEGLIAPAVLDCHTRDIESLAIGLADLAERARAGRLRSAEIASATFTLSNLGMFGVSSFTAIITPPQVAILATASAEPRAVVRDGDVVVRTMMTATLSADHRVVDGASAARFLGALKAEVEHPAGLA